MTSHDEFALTDLSPRVWADAFPWLRSKAHETEAGDWWEQPIDDASTEERAVVLHRVADLAVERLSGWSIGHVFPGLPAGVALGRLDLLSRARTVLSRERVRTTSDLSDVTVEGMLGFRSAGIGTVTAILVALADLSSSLPRATLVRDEEQAVAPVDPWLGSLIGDLEILAAWQLSIGQSDRGLLGELPHGAPVAVVAARRRLHQLTADEVNPYDGANIADHLSAALSVMDGRYLSILAKRVFAWRPLTLDELGKEFGVTRERVRQLEVKARARLADLVRSDGSVGDVVAFMRAQIRGVRPLDEVLDEAPALGHVVEEVGQPAWRILDILDDAYEISGGWCAEPSLEAARRETAVFLDELADDYGVVRLADVGLTGAAPGSLAWLPEWLSHIGYELRDDYVLLRTRSLNDLAAAVLSIEGAPLTAEELHLRAGRGSANSLRNQLYSDNTFHRIDRDHWALAEWGMEAYTNIRAEIAKLLDQDDGELALDTVVQSLVDRFGVAPGSVTTYAGSPPFEIWNGVVRSREHTYIGGKNPSKVRGYYRRRGDWLHRTVVTHDHLRGSGWPASTALATITHLSPGELVSLPSRLGDQRFTWKGHQPAFGSIKRFLEDLDVGIGDEVFLVFKEDGTFDVEPVPELPEDRMAQALTLVGADPSLPLEAAIAALGEAIRYAPGADLISIAHAYKTRREDAIFELITASE